jgi:hypothetical protein
MRVALLSESPADETALRVLIKGVLGRVTFAPTGFRARGWPNVAQVLPSVIRHLHFNTDTEVLAVVVDSDDSVVHGVAHEAPGYFHPQCRLCQLRAIFRQTQKKLRPVAGRVGVVRGVGIAVPAIEAWYLCGRDHAVSEAAWVAGQAAGKPPYTRAELKWRVYGTDRPSLPLEIECALREVARHREDPRRLEHEFPGFAALAADLRTGMKPPSVEKSFESDGAGGA